MSKVYFEKNAQKNAPAKSTSASNDFDYAARYGISSSQAATIKRYQSRIGDYDWVSSYKYDPFDDEDATRQAQGIIPKSLQKTYKNTAVDRALFHLGLPSQSKIESIASKAETDRETRRKQTIAAEKRKAKAREQARQNAIADSVDLEDYIGGMGTDGTFQRDENGYLPAATSTAQAAAPAASNTAAATAATATTATVPVYDPNNVDKNGITWKRITGVGIDANGDLYTKNPTNQQIFKVQDKEAFLRMQRGDFRSSVHKKQPVRDEKNKITWQDDNWGIGDNGVYYVKDKDGTIRRQYETSDKPVAIEGKASNDIFLPDSDGRYSINGQLMTADELREAVKDPAFGMKSTGVVQEGVSRPGTPTVYYTNQEASRYIDRRAEKDKKTADKARVEALTDKYYNETLPSRSDFDEIAAKGADVEIPVANRTGKLSGYDMSSSPYENTARVTAGENSLLNYMTPDERKIYDYLRGTGDEQAAQKYWDTIAEDLETRWTNRAIVQGEVEGKEQGWFPALLNKTANSLAGTITGTAHILSQTVQGKEVNPYNSAFAGQLAAGAALDSATEGWSPTAKKAINIFSSVLDNAARYGLLGPAGKAASLGFMATGAFQNSYRDVKARGGNDEQAMVVGLLNGAVEVATESLGFDRMMAAFNGSAAAQNAWEYAIKQTVTSMFPEGMEEIASEVADIVVDEVVMKDKSEIQQAIAAYRRQYPNASEQDIFTLVNDTIRGRVIDSGIGGMVSGGFMTGASSLAGASMNAIGERQNIIEAQNLLEDVGYMIPSQANDTAQTYDAASEIGQQYALEQQLQEVERQLDVDPENLQLQMEYVRITDALNRGDYSGVDAAQEDAAGEALDNQIAEQAATERTNALRNQPYADLLSELNQTRFSPYGISDTMRKTMGNAVNLTGNTDISAKYAELSQRFPSLFPVNVEGVENQLGQINRVIRQLRSGQIDARAADLAIFRDDAHAQQAAVEAREAARRQMQSLQDRLNGIPDKTSKQALKLQAQIDVLAQVAGTQTQTQNAEELADLTERLSAYDAFPGQETDPIVSGAQSFVGDNTNAEFESEQDRIQRLIQQANQQQAESSMLYPFTQQEQNMFDRAEWERRYQEETRQAEEARRRRYEEYDINALRNEMYHEPELAPFTMEDESARQADLTELANLYATPPADSESFVDAILAKNEITFTKKDAAEIDRSVKKFYSELASDLTDPRFKNIDFSQSDSFRSFVEQTLRDGRVNPEEAYRVFSEMLGNATIQPLNANQELHDELQNLKINPASLKDDTSKNEYLREVFSSKINFKRTGENLDEAYQRLKEKYPNFFQTNSQFVWNKLNAIANAIDSTQDSARVNLKDALGEAEYDQYVNAAYNTFLDKVYDLQGQLAPIVTSKLERSKLRREGQPDDLPGYEGEKPTLPEPETETPVEQMLPAPVAELEAGEELYVPPERDYSDYGPIEVTVIQPEQTNSNQEMQPLPVPESPQTDVLPQNQQTQPTQQTQQTQQPAREPRRTVPRVTDLTPQEVQHVTEWSDAVEKYGAQDMGMEPAARHDAVPKSVDGATKVSKSVRTLYESPATPDTAVADFEQAVLSGLGSYTEQTFDQVINAANARRANADSDVAQAAANFDAEIDGSMAGRARRSLSVTAEDIAYAAILYKEAMAKGDTKTAHNIAATTASIMTNYGQVINAMKLFKLMTPEGRFSVYERLAQQAAREASWFKKGMTFDIEIDPALKDAFIKADIAATQDASDANMAALREAEAAIKKNIAEQVPVTMRSRIDALRNLNMLGNFKTYARNYFGNATMLGQRYLRDKISGLYQDVFIHDPSQQTATWRSELTQEQKAEAKAWAYQQAEANQSTLQGEGGKYAADMNEIRDMSRQIAGENNVFDKALFTLSDFVGDKLEEADATFLKANYRQSLYEFMKAQNLTVDQMQGKTLAMAQSYATLQALKATYRDNSKLADAIRKMSDSGGLASFLIEGLMPYKRTPINIAKRGVEYSPLGWANVLRLALGAKSKGYTGAQIANAAAESTIGTGLAVLGYILAKAGVLRASGSDPDKANYEKGMGKQSYSLDVFGGNISLDWLQPTAMPFFVGARFAELLTGNTATEGETRPADMIGMGLDALTSVVSPVLEMSCMNGLQDAIESVQYQQIGENAPVTIAVNLALSYLSQLTQNSLLRQVARSIDPIRRDPYYSTAQTAGGQAVERLVNQTMNGIPGLSQMLPAYVNKDGEIDRYWEEGDEAGALWNFVQQTVLPWNTGRGTTTPLDEERLAVYDATGENVLSGQSGKSVKYNGKTYQLEAPERAEYKQNYGRIQAEYGEQLMDSEGYRMAGPEMRASMLNDLASYAKAQADIRFLRSKGVEIDPKSNAASAFKSAGKIDLAMERGIYIGDYLAVKYVKSQIGSVKDPVSGKTIKDGNKRRVEEYMKQIGLTQDQIEFMQEVLY